jgi:ATP-dependent RNA helicase DHX8/PRP22
MPQTLLHELMVHAGTYRLVATNQLVMIHPSSVLSGRKAACIVFDELVQTARLYARNVTAIEPGWLPELAPHLFRMAPTTTI